MGDAKEGHAIPPAGTQYKILAELFEIGLTTFSLGVIDFEIAAHVRLIDLRKVIFTEFTNFLKGHHAVDLILKPEANEEPMTNMLGKLYSLPFFHQDVSGLHHLRVEVARLNTPLRLIASPIRPRYLDLLKKRSRDLVINDTVWNHIVRLFASRLLSILEEQNVDAACALLTDAKAILSSVTVGALERSGFAILSEPVRAYHSDSSDFYKGYETSSGRPVILKCPHKKKSRREIKVCEDLKLEENKVPGLVHIAVHRISIREGPKNDRNDDESDDNGSDCSDIDDSDDERDEDQRQEMVALVMPDFSETLRIAFKLKPECIVSRSKAVIEGLNWLHGRGYVHMDVKGANIFVLANGEWSLGDFGSCVRVNEPIKTTTVWCYPKLLKSSDVALFEYDWYMLAVALLAATQRHNSQIQGPRLLDFISDGGSRVEDEKIKAAIAQTQHEPLRDLLAKLVACKTADFH